MNNNNINLKKGKHLSYQEKLKIEGFLANNNILDYHKDYASNKIIQNTKRKYRVLVYELSDYLGRCKRTIKRELERGKVEQTDYLGRIYYAYSADKSNSRYIEMRKEDTRALKIDKNINLFYFIANLLKKKYSPYACIQLAINEGLNPKFTSRTLLNYIRKGLFDSLGIKPNHSLYQQKKVKKEKCAKLIRKGKYNSIEDRPDEINKRLEVGNWEIDTVVGNRTGKNKALLVLTDRCSRYQIIKLIDDKTSNSVSKTLNEIINENKALSFKTFTSDNGSEFYSIDNVCKHFNLEWYYCHPYSSSERGSNENNNRFIRRFFPKGSSFNNLSNKEIEYIQDFMNNYPRKIFNGKTSKNIYFENKNAA